MPGWFKLARSGLKWVIEICLTHTHPQGSRAARVWPLYIVVWHIWLGTSETWHGMELNVGTFYLFRACCVLPTLWKSVQCVQSTCEYDIMQI